MDSTTYMKPYTTGNAVYNSFSDWGLSKTSRTVITPPQIKSMTVDIPGGDGSIDLSDALTGDVAYQNRTYTDNFVFIGDRRNRERKINEISSALCGDIFEIEIDALPGWVYVGRPVITNIDKSSDCFLHITVSCEIEPYRYEKLYSDDPDWLWDSFCFIDGVIRGYRDIEVNGDLKMIIKTFKQKIFPYIEQTDGSGITVGNSLTGKYYPLPVSDKIMFRKGENTIYFKGNGKIRMRFRAGDI